MTQEQAATIQRSQSGIEDADGAIADMIAQLEEAGGDIGKSLGVILKAILSFTGGTRTAAGMFGGSEKPMTASEGARVLEKTKFFAPFSTTNITSAFDPYAGVSGDPKLVDKILENKDKKFLGYRSEKQMRQFVGDGLDQSTALRGNLYGAKTEYFAKLRDIASAKKWDWTTNDDLEALFNTNEKSLKEDSDPEVKSLIAAKKEYDDYKKKYFDFLKAIHGKQGYNDEEFFLAKNGAEKYDDLLSAWENQSKVAEAFYSEKNRASIDGKKAAMLPEAAFLGVTGRSGDTSYVGRTDLASLRTETLEMLDGTKKDVNILDLVDLKTKMGEKLSSGDILQGLMNAYAARQDIEFAKNI